MRRTQCVLGGFILFVSSGCTDPASDTEDRGVGGTGGSLGGAAGAASGGGGQNAGGATAGGGGASAGTAGSSSAGTTGSTGGSAGSGGSGADGGTTGDEFDPCPHQGTTCKVMPLGDSITAGDSSSGSYRTALWSLIADGGGSVDFVGSGTNGPESLPDHDHEGHPGFRIDQTDSGLDAWLTPTQPQIVVLLIGTNDVLQNVALQDAPARLEALLDLIFMQLPQTLIVVGSIPPLDTAANAQVLEYNASLKTIVETREASGEHISYVDIYATIDAANDLPDDVHPNVPGYTKMAAAWYPALEPFLQP